MILKIKVKKGGMSEVFNIEKDTVNKCKRQAIELFLEKHPKMSELGCKVEVLDGIFMSYVSLLMKPITGRRMVFEEIEPYAIHFGLKKQFQPNGHHTYYWGDKQIEELQTILINEKNYKRHELSKHFQI